MNVAKIVALALATSVAALAGAAPAGPDARVEVVNEDPDARDRVCSSSDVGKAFRRQEAVVEEACSNGSEVCQKILVYRDWTVASKSRDGRACMWKEGRRQFSMLECEPRPDGFQGRTCLSVGQQYLIRNR